MKKIVLRLALLTGLLFALVGCDKDNPAGANDGDDDNVAGTFTCSIAGDLALNFNAPITGGFTDQLMVGVTGTMTVGGSQYMVTITVYPATMPPSGSYDIVSFGDEDPISNHKASAIVTRDAGTANGQTYWGYTGRITFTANGDRLKGTFYFTGRVDVAGSPEVQVTQGTFDVLKTVVN